MLTPHNLPTPTYLKAVSAWKKKRRQAPRASRNDLPKTKADKGPKRKQVTDTRRSGINYIYAGLSEADLMFHLYVNKSLLAFFSNIF